MSILIKINGTTVSNVKREFPLNDRLDEELDSGVLIVINKRSTVYDPMSKVDIYITSEVTPDHTYLVDSDECVLTARDLGIYQHTIALIEPTKLEERYYVDNIAFTQPTDGSTRYNLDDVLERVNAITPLEQDTLHSGTRLFSLDSTMLTELSTVKAPQLYFSQQHFRQVTDEVLRYVSSISRIRTYSGSTPIITRDNFGQLKGVVSGVSSVDMKTNNSEYFINEMDMQVDNGISGVLEVFPDEPLFMSLTTEDFIVTTNDMILKLPKPIYKLEKLVIATMIVQEVRSPVNKQLFTFEQDMTAYVYEEELYNLLTIEQKKLAVYYKKGDNKIQGFGVAYPQLFGLFPSTVFQNIYGDLPYALSLDPSFSGDNMIKGIFSFRAYYYPYTSQRLRVYKDVPVSTNRYQVAANQSAKALDITRLLDNAQGVINRLGNGDIMLEKVVDDYADRYQVGQYTSDGHIVTSVENLINDGYFRSKAVLTKNFNRLSQFIGVDREYRQYNLPLNETVNRNLYYEEFVTFSTVPQSTSTPSWSAGGISWLRYMFDYTEHSNYDDYSIKHIIVNTKDASKSSYGKFVVGATKNYHRNSISFHFSFETNNVAFFSPSDTIETPVTGVSATSLQPIYYTDADGEFTYMDFMLGDTNYFDSVADNVPVFTTITAAKSWFDSNYTSYPNGIIVRLTTGWYTSYIDLDGVTEVFDTFYYAWIIRDSGVSSAGGVYEEDVLHMFYYFDQTSTLAVYNGTVLKPKQYRKMPSVYTNDGNALCKLTDLVVHKDASEVISMTYQLHFVPTDARIVLGQKMMENNPYLVERSSLLASSTDLYLYRSSELYRDGDTKCKGSAVASPFAGFTNSSYTNGFVLQASNVSLFSSWAIGDENGNLYIGVNRSASGLPEDIFVQFKNKL